MLTCLKRFKATNVHFMLKTLAPGKSTGFFTLFRYFTPFGYSNSRICIIRISMLRIIPLVFRRFPRISTIVRLSVTVVFRGQKDRDQRSRPTRKLYDKKKEKKRNRTTPSSVSRRGSKKLRRSCVRVFRPTTNEEDIARISRSKARSTILTDPPPCHFLSISSFIVFNYRIDNAIKIHRVN